MCLLQQKTELYVFTATKNRALCVYCNKKQRLYVFTATKNRGAVALSKAAISDP
jgi:hypothetical protein